MKKINPVGKKVQVTLREIAAIYPFKEMGAIHEKLLNALDSNQGSHDFCVIASLLNNSKAQANIVKSILKAIEEIDAGVASQNTFNAIVSAAGFELEENGCVLKQHKRKVTA